MKKAIFLVGIIAIILVVGVVAVSQTGGNPLEALQKAISELTDRVDGVEADIATLSAAIDGGVDGNGAQPLTYKIYLNIAGIEGSSQAMGHENGIEVESLGHEITPSDQGEFTITKVFDKSSPLLYLAAAGGEHFDTAEIEFCKIENGGELCTMKWEFEDVIITKIMDKSSPYLFGGESLPIEEVSFNYAKIKWSYTEAPGSTPIITGWNLVENKKI